MGQQLFLRDMPGLKRNEELLNLQCRGHQWLMTYSLCWDCEEVSNAEHVKLIKIFNVDLKLLILSQFISDVCRHVNKLSLISSIDIFMDIDESTPCFIKVNEVSKTTSYCPAFCACTCEMAYYIATMFMKTLA